jgi:hypothetical protein
MFLLISIFIDMFIAVVLAVCGYVFDIHIGKVEQKYFNLLIITAVLMPIKYCFLIVFLGNCSTFNGVP